MQVINEGELHKFARRHPQARKPLSNWSDITKESVWNNFLQVRETFNSADYVSNLVVFDIAGNKYRLIVSISYAEQRVYVLEVMTHAEYDRWQP